MREAEHDWLDALAEDVADGRVIDWAARESTAADDRTRAIIRRLRAVAAIGQAHADLTLTDMASDSLSVRSQLPGFDDPSDPTHWGPLRILERVGRGRFGDVYRAWDPSLDREVALKLLRRRDDSTGSDREVIEEGRLMARVRHENVVAIYGAQRIDGRTGLWMEFVDGNTLETEITNRGPFPPAEVADIGVQLCRALAAVHEAGLLHRDVKTQNVLRDRTGRVVLGDFGTGYELDDDVSAATALTGTPSYLAPEIFAGAPASVRTDVYSLGVLLFRLATGNLPVRGSSLARLREAHVEGRRISLKSLRPVFPVPLTEIIERAISPTPIGRFENAAAIERALSTYLATPVASEHLRDTHQRRFRTAALGGVVAAALVTLTLAFGAWNGRRPEQGRTLPAAASKTVAPEQPDRISPAQPADQQPIQNGGAAVVPATAEQTPTRTFRHLPGLRFNLGRPSPDGRLVSHFSPVDGALELFDVIAGTTRRVAGTESGQPATIAEPGGFSRDGTRITFLKLLSPVVRSLPRSAWPAFYPEIWSVPVAGGPGRLVWRSSVAHQGVQLHQSASRDDLILMSTTSEAGSEFLVLSPTGAVIASRLVPLGARNATLSPDNRYVAFDRVDPPSGRRDIDVWSIDAETVTPLIQDASSDHSAMWTHDGRHLLFVSTRSGSSALWAQLVEHGHARGLPTLLDPTIGEARLRGLTVNGALFLARISGSRQTYLVQADPRTLHPTSEPRRASTRSSGTTSSPAWSPSGRHLAFVHVEDESVTIVVRTIGRDTDQEFPLKNSAAPVDALRWEPGGRSLLFRGLIERRLGLGRLDLETGQVAPVWRAPIDAYDVLPEHGSIVLSRRGSTALDIVRVDLATDAQTVLHHTEDAMITQLRTSRRGDRIAFMRFGKNAPSSIRILDLTGPGVAHDVISVTPGDPVPSLLGWSPDDSEILVRRPVTADDKPLTPGLGVSETVWAIEVATGRMRIISPLQVRHLAGVESSPDGRYLAIDAGGGPESEELWVLENALASLPL